jgi:TonB-linked SusC/RagA family outer membrane protein
MEKFELFRISKLFGIRKKWLIAMKTLILLVCVFSIQLNASVLSQQTVSLNMSNVSAKELIREIEAQTNLGFIYNLSEIEKLDGISIEAEEQTVKEILDQVLENTDLTYELDKSVIIIMPKPAEPVKKEVQQKKTIKGKVTDDQGIPLPGVSVVIKGTNVGVATDIDGNYALELEGENLVLLYSFVGMIPQEIAYSGQAIHDVTLLPDAKQMEEIVVVGYGSSKRERIGSAISEIKSEKLEEQALGVASFENIIGGNIKGLQVSQGSGAPGSAATIRIRGITSPFSGGNNQPLYVIDGVEFNTDQQGGGVVSAYTQNPLEAINPNDIKSISVLKDAGATAIYGSRGANGVIIVTTKRGYRNSNLSVSFDASLSFSNPTKTFDLLNADEFKQLHQMVAKNTYEKTGGTNDIAKLIYNGTDFNDTYFDGVLGKDVPMWGTANTDWQDEVYRKNAPIQKYNLSMSGGNNKTNYSLSMNYSDRDGLIMNDNQRTYGSRLTLDSDVKDWLRIGSTINVSGSNNTRGGEGQNDMFAARPDYAIKNPNGTYLKQPLVGGISVSNTGELSYTVLNANPVASTLGKNVTKSSSIFANGYMEIQPIKDLKLRSELNVAKFNSKNKAFEPYEAIDFDFTDPNPVYNSKDLNYSNSLNTTLSFQANYLKEMNDHTISVMAGISSTKSRFETELFDFFNTPDNEIITNIDLASLRNATELKSESVMNSWFSRVQYDYKGKYALTLNMRSDKSSKFGPGKKTGYFPSSAVSWNIHQEDFMDIISVVSNLKLRTSYGKTGLANLSDFSYLQYFTAPDFNKVYLGKDILYPTEVYPNVNIGWETTKEFNIGLDFALFDNRLYGSVDYYDKYSDGVIMQTPVFPESGSGSMFSNRAEISNKGLEFEVGGDIIRNNDFVWSASFNIAFNRNKLESIKGNALSKFILEQYIEGEPIGTIKGLQVDHIIKDQNEIDELNAKAQAAGHSFYQDGATGVGDYLYRDTNGDGKVDSEDEKILGSQEADFFGGFTTNLRYKNFSFSAAFQYSVGNEKIWNNMQNSHLYPRLFANMEKDAMYNTYTNGNENAKYPMLTYGNNSNYSFQGGLSSVAVQDASYLRLKVVNFSYQLPKRITDKLKIEAMSVYVGGSNLLTFTNYKGLDPESTGGIQGTGSVLSGTMGSDIYPMVRNYTFGVKVTF